MAFFWLNFVAAPPSTPRPVTFCPFVSWLEVWDCESHFSEVRGPSHEFRATHPGKPDCAETAGFWQTGFEKQC